MKNSIHKPTEVHSYPDQKLSICTIHGGEKLRSRDVQATNTTKVLPKRAGCIKIFYYTSILAVLTQGYCHGPSPYTGNFNGVFFSPQILHFLSENKDPVSLPYSWIPTKS